MTDRIVRVVMRGDIVGLKTAMAEGAQVVKATADKLTAADKQGQKYRAGLKTLGNQAGTVGLIAAAGFGLAVKSAADFNAEMALVRTLSHAGASDMDKLSHAALTVGQNIGYSAKAVAQGEEELVKAGVSVKDILGGGLKGALDLAAAGQTDVATASSIAAAALTEFGLKGKDVPHVADELAAGADKALGSVEDLGIGLSQAGTTAHQMGLTLEQTVGTLTAFAQAGLIGERGGTTLKMMLLRLADPSKKAQDAMDKYGISLYNASGQIKTMPELAGNLSDALKGISPQARNAALGIIFGSRAIQGANILMANGADGIQEWINKTNDQGFAAQQAAGKLDSLAGDAKKLGTALQTAFIETGSGGQGPLRVLAQDATSAVTAFNKMPDSLHSTVSGMLAITAITGGGLWFGSKAIRGIADTRAALDNLGVDSVRVGGMMRTALAAGAILEGLNLVGQGIDSLFNTDINTTNLGRSLDALAANKVTGEIKDKWGADLKGFGQAAVDATSSIQNMDDAVGGTLGRLAKHVPIAGGFLSGPVGSSIDNIKKLDDALAGLVESGKQDQAAAIFDQLAVAANKAGVSTHDLEGLFKQYEISVGNAETASLSSSGAAVMMSRAMTGLLGPTQAAGKAASQGAVDQEAMAKALESSRKAANKTAHEFFGLGKSVNDSKVSLNGWISDLEKQAKSLRDFTKNAQTAGKKGLKEGLIAELEAAGPEGAMRMKQLADASEVEIRRANRAWRSGQRAIDRYTNVVGGVAPIVATDLQVDGVPVAISAVAELKRLLNSLHDRNIHVKVTKSTNAVVAEAAANNGPAKAWGGTVAGSRWPYGDKVLTPTAPGEEIISNAHGQADKNRSVLKAANAGARIAVVGYAAGGTTPSPASSYDIGRRQVLISSSPGPASSSSGGASMRLHAEDLTQLVRGLASVRPIADHITLQPHNSGEWERLQQTLTQAAGIGGIPR